MADKTKLLILLALAIGLLGDGLFKGTGLGMNVALIGCGVCGVALLFRRSFFQIPFITFATMFAIRDSVELRVANGVGMAVSLGASMVKAGEPSVALATAYDYTARLATALFRMPLAFVELLLAHLGTDLSQNVTVRKHESTARGIAIAAPFVALFALLFVSADARFEGWMSNLARFDMYEVAVHMSYFLAFTVVCGGFLALIYKPPSMRTVGFPGRIGIAEATTALWAINALFVAFVVCQLSYLFGQNSGAVTLAAYARRGFFELAWVATIVLALVPLLRGMAGDERFSKRLNASLSVLIACVLIIIGSAFWRMGLYINAYGLTMLRTYTTAFMVWLLLTFVWMLATTMRKGENRFAFGSLVAGLTCILALNVANPDALIARANLSLERASADVGTFSKLSADAVPTILSRFEKLPPESRDRLLKQWRTRLRGGDWRKYNFAMQQARQALVESGRQ